MGEQLRLGWRVSRYSATNGNCIEVAADSAVKVRDSQDRTGGTLAFTGAAWEAFLAALRA
jgi:hypothetical protein